MMRVEAVVATDTEGHVGIQVGAERPVDPWDVIPHASQIQPATGDVPENGSVSGFGELLEFAAAAKINDF